MGKRHEYFYGKPVLEEREQEYIEKILSKYRSETASPELKKKIWDELQHEKHLGNITIPFKVVYRHDAYGKYPDAIEVILDTKL